MIERETVDRVVIVRLAHGSVNAIDIELAAAIRDTFTALAEGPHVGVVLTGTGGAFSAGVDLRRLVSEGADYARSFVPVLVEAFEAVFNVEKPVVAAVNGHAIAGGCVLVCACDRRLMADGPGRIGVTELLAGVPFPRVALEILKFAVGASRATGLVLKGTTCEPAGCLGRGPHRRGRPGGRPPRPRGVGSDLARREDPHRDVPAEQAPAARGSQRQRLAHQGPRGARGHRAVGRLGDLRMDRRVHVRDQGAPITATASGSLAPLERQRLSGNLPLPPEQNGV